MNRDHRVEQELEYIILFVNEVEIRAPAAIIVKRGRKSVRLRCLVKFELGAHSS